MNSLIQSFMFLTEDGANDAIVTDSYLANYHIIGVNGKYMFSRSGLNLLYSFNGGVSWVNSTVFSDGGEIVSGFMFSNGNCAWFTHTKAYFSDNNLLSYSEITPLLPNDDEYIIHTPTDPDYPGSYYAMLNAPNIQTISGVEMIVWGNYGNYIYGNNPVNIYSCTHSGDLRVVYQFGQNPTYTDGGNLLGDPNNTIIARHIHSCRFNPYNNKWYFFTGDSSTEIYFFSGSISAGVWTWEVVLSYTAQWIKAAGIVFVDDYIYWVTDITSANPNQNGIWYCKISELGDISKHAEFSNMQQTINNQMIDLIYDEATDNFMGLSFSQNNTIWICNKTDPTKEKYIGPVSGVVRFTQISKKNNFGYYSMLTNYIWENGTPSYLIKIGHDVFDS